MYVCHQAIYADANSKHQIIKNIPPYIQINFLTPFGKSVYLTKIDSRMDALKRGSPLNLHGLFYSANGQSTFECLDVVFRYHHEALEINSLETFTTYRLTITQKYDG